MKSLNLRSTKKGAASIYVVVFATILFGVITLSFIRIILSESGQTSNDDLSQSAYDAAMAGVEDAKIAVNKYYQCKSNPSGADCAKYLTLFDDQNCTDAPLPQILYGLNGDDEVKITEKSDSGTDGSTTENNTDQAYTCVLLSNKVDDYRSTLTSDTRTRVVPIGIGATDLSKVKYIEFEWYSELNGTKESFQLNKDGTLHPKSETTIPPTISLSLLKTGNKINLNDFNDSISDNSSTMILLPSDTVQDEHGNELSVTEISQAEITKAANSDVADNGHSVSKTPYRIRCDGGAFACSVTLGTSASQLNFTSGGNAMLVVSLPYGDTITDFAVTLCGTGGCDNDPISFENVQVSVDSTGRANQLVRRVESRLDPADVFFPYPQYEVQLDGEDDDSLLKSFWITANCWTEYGLCNNNGEYKGASSD